VPSGSGRQKRSPRGAGYSGQSKRKFGRDQRIKVKDKTDPRRVEALEEARKAQERLDRRIAREQHTPTMGKVAGAEWTPPLSTESTAPSPPPQPPAPSRSIPGEDLHPLQIRFPDIPWEGDGDGTWTPGQARKLLREGYNIRKVVRDTSVGMKWLSDIPVDRAGFGED
jgi:hypothetical protein